MWLGIGCKAMLPCPPHLPPSLLHPCPPSKLKTRPCDTGSTNHPLPGPARRAGGWQRGLLGAAGDARVLPAAAAAVVQDLQVEQLLRVAEGRVVQRAGRGQPGAGPVLGRDVVQPAEPPVAAGTRQGGCGSARRPGWGPSAHPHATPVTSLASADRRFPPKFHSTGAGPSPAPWVGAEPVTPNNNIWPQPRGCCGGFLGNNPPRHVTKPCPGGRRGQDSAVPPPALPDELLWPGCARSPLPTRSPTGLSSAQATSPRPGGRALCFPTGGTGGVPGTVDLGAHRHISRVSPPRRVRKRHSPRPFGATAAPSSPAAPSTPFPPARCSPRGHACTPTPPAQPGGTAVALRGTGTSRSWALHVLPPPPQHLPPAAIGRRRVFFLAELSPSPSRPPRRALALPDPGWAALPPGTRVRGQSCCLSPPPAPPGNRPRSRSTPPSRAALEPSPGPPNTTTGPARPTCCGSGQPWPPSAAP